MKIKHLILSIALLLTACTDESGARRVLENAGYTHIEITGYRAFMGDKNDTLSTGFKAIGPNGKPVTGAVTKGLAKGSTIRFD